MASVPSPQREQVEMEFKDPSILLKSAPLKSEHISSPTITTKHAPSLDVQSRCIGIICISICIVTWIGMAELETALFANTPFTQKPFFLQYCANVSLMLCIIPWCILETIDRLRCQEVHPCPSHRISSHRTKSLSRRRTMSESVVINTMMMPTYHSINLTVEPSKSLKSTPSARDLMVPAITVSGLLAFQNYLWFMSLRSTIVAINTTIYQ